MTDNLVFSPASYPYDPGLGPLVEEFVADRGALGRRYPLSKSAVSLDRTGVFLRDWQTRLAQLPWEALTSPARLDHALFDNHLRRALREMEREREEADRLAALFPFGEAIVGLDAARMAMEPPDPAATAETLDRLAREMAAVEPLTGDAPAAAWLGELKAAMERWGAFHAGYDPVLDWWTRVPLAGVMAQFERLAPPAEESGEIPGRPVGRAALEEDLAFDLIPYSPEELIAIGEREYAWCLDEMLRASREMGYGEDWKRALEAAKDDCVPPGGQPAMVRGLALEAIEYVRDLVTVPPLAEEVWRMEMMTAEAQKTNPFFLGGEAIVVSYPTDAMGHAEKRMSMRGNNPNLSRATVQHELIPGHHLQMYTTERSRPYRRLFTTPFWIEGWTLYWEILLWELGFPRTPQERIGMLFWRMHRCVRVSFSLRFHLGELTTAECVETLVERVGHERLNAECEVRRSFNGLYPPLYQAAYLIGGLQFRAISRELRAQGRSYREVHDAMLRENEMPPALMRLALLGEDPPEGGAPVWRFDDGDGR